jgi:hypothetical protein
LYRLTASYEEGPGYGLDPPLERNNLPLSQLHHNPLQPLLELTRKSFFLNPFQSMPNFMNILEKKLFVRFQNKDNIVFFLLVSFCLVFWGFLVLFV